jgi:Immunity protein 27
MLRELNDVWEFCDGRMRAVGDARSIDDLLKNKLVEVRKEDWAILYRDKETGEFWDLTYPQSEMHGGGPRRLREVSNPNDWTPYPKGTTSKS